MTSNLVTNDNWNASGYKNNDLQVFMTFGADPAQESQLLYFVTLMDNDFKEIFQKEFTTSQSAISFINQRYSNWEFVERSGGSGEGCGTCEAK